MASALRDKRWGCILHEGQTLLGDRNEVGKNGGKSAVAALAA